MKLLITILFTINMFSQDDNVLRNSIAEYYTSNIISEHKTNLLDTIRYSSPNELKGDWMSHKNHESGMYYVLINPKCNDVRRAVFEGMDALFDKLIIVKVL